MKLAARDMAAFLAAPTRYRAVLIYGVDEGLVRERRKIVLEKSCASDDPFGLIELAGDQVEKDPTRLYEALASYSLIGTPPVVWVRDGGGKAGAVILEALAESTGNFLLVTASELDSRNALRKTFEERNDLAALACYFDESETLEKIIRSFFAKHSIQSTPEVVAYLRQNLGNDRGVTLSELDKIAVYLGDEKQLTAESAQALVGQNSLLALDDLAYALAEGNANALFSIGERLLQEQGHPVALLRGMMRIVERLLLAKSMMAQGKNADQAMMALRPPVFFKEKDRMKRALTKRSITQLEALLSQLLIAELHCKRTNEPSIVFMRAMSDVIRQ
ncbi:MAG: DNA polymerase III subunit delta [Rickettsiales bacterium]|nr:DNA polymerase III subunit delta [Rickettsiales bacterium]